jgi:tetratricopeptide (TPR) repeat protein
MLLVASCLRPVCAALQGEDAASISTIAAAISDLPLEPAAHLEIDLALKAHNYEAVEETLMRVASQHPKMPLLYNCLGRIFFIDAKYLNAAIAMKKAEALQPLEERDRFTLAMAYVAMEKPGWARPVLEKLAEASPKNSLYPYWQGRLDYDQQKLSDAAAKFEKAIALDSGFGKAYDNLGLCLEGMGKYNEAIQQYQRAVQLNRESKVHSAWPPLNLGLLLVKSNRAEEAELLFRESLQLDANFAEAHYHLGVLLEQHNKINEAMEELKRAGLLAPAYPQPHYALARVYRRAGKKEDAKRELEIFQTLNAKVHPPRVQ